MSNEHLLAKKRRDGLVIPEFIPISGLNPFFSTCVGGVRGAMFVGNLVKSSLPESEVMAKCSKLAEHYKVI